MSEEKCVKTEKREYTVLDFYEDKEKKYQELEELEEKRRQIVEEIEDKRTKYEEFINTFLFKDNEIKARIDFSDMEF